VLSHIRSDGGHCPILVGSRSGRGVPGGVVYEARGLDVFLLRASDTPEEGIQRIGKERTIPWRPLAANLKSIWFGVSDIVSRSVVPLVSGWTQHSLFYGRS
jgi:hypothetical protein